MLHKFIVNMYKTNINIWVQLPLFRHRIDTGDDNRISKEEFTTPALKSTVELWVGPIADMAAEFDSIDKNGGGQILFDEFVDWATSKNLDIEDDDD